MIFAQNRRVFREVFLAIFLVIGVGLFEFLGLLEPMKSLGQKLTIPFLETNSKIVTVLAQPYRNLKISRKAVRRVQDLEIKYAEVSAQLGELEALRAENKELRNLLENSDRKLQKTVLSAPIISLAQPSISVGMADGVNQGNIVIGSQTLLGTVSRVYENQSEVGLLSHLNSQPILAKTESGVQGLIIGDGKRVLLSEIPIDEEIKINDRVVTLGQKGVPRDIFIGRVRSIEREPHSSVQVAVIEQFVSFYEILVVEIR